MRMCAVTREKLPKKQLVRLVLLKENKTIEIDSGQKLKGRGLNIKPDMKVFEEAIKKRVFERSFKVKLEDKQISKLRNSFEKYIDNSFRETKVVRISSEKLAKIIKGKRNG